MASCSSRQELPVFVSRYFPPIQFPKASCDHSAMAQGGEGSPGLSFHSEAQKNSNSCSNPISFLPPPPIRLQPTTTLNAPSVCIWSAAGSPHTNERPGLPRGERMCFAMQTPLARGIFSHVKQDLSALKPANIPPSLSFPTLQQRINISTLM